MSTEQTYKTKQRELIVNYLKSTYDEHITVSKICQHFKNSGKHIGIATIYRQLEKLIEEGIVRKYYIDNITSACFQLITDHGNCHSHVHFKCEVCGTLFCIECNELEILKNHFSKEHNMVIDSVKTIFYGKCPSCINNK